MIPDLASDPIVLSDESLRKLARLIVSMQRVGRVQGNNDAARPPSHAALAHPTETRDEGTQ